MKTSFRIITALFLTSSLCSAQVSIGSISKEQKEEVIIPVPEYDPYEGFSNYDDFYGGDGYANKCKELDFYKRYYNLDVYYPTYSNDYKEGNVLVFKKEGGIILLDWSAVAENYYTIKNIETPFEKSSLFNEVLALKPNINNILKSGLLFILVDKKTKETIYVVEFNNPSFVLTEYYSTISNAIPKKTFVALKDFNGKVLPLSENLLFVEKGSEWKGELTLLREADMNLDKNYNSPDLQNLLFMVVLSRGSDKIITYFNSKDYYETLFSLFDTKENIEAEKLATEKEAKQKLEKLTQLYGVSFANDIVNNRLTIGMTKEMCQESVGITLNRRSYTDANKQIEVWEYVGSRKLFFTNGKLTNIITY